MTLPDVSDLAEPDGPFAAAYREHCERAGRHADDYVPLWFLRMVVRERLVAMETVLTELDPLCRDNDTSRVMRALSVLFDFLNSSLDPRDLKSRSVAAFLGAGEVVERRERGWTEANRRLS